jgi:uncharacterized protein (TIGR02147 family)
MSPAAVDVYHYLDYRKLLRDYYARRKRSGRAFSFRAFSRRAGLKSPNHLKRVMDGDRNLSDESSLRYADALGLAGDEAQYFCELVRFGQAKTTKERGAAYRRLTEYRGYQRAHRLDAKRDRYHSEWYIPAVRELFGCAGFREDPAWIAAQLVPAITERQAAEALSVLEDLGLVRRDESGALLRSEQVVSTGAETSGVHIVNYHRTMMEKATQSIDLVPRDARDISGVTLCLPAGSIPLLKERVQAFRTEIIAMESEIGTGDQVVQVSIQIFPLSRGRREP